MLLKSRFSGWLNSFNGWQRLGVVLSAGWMILACSIAVAPLIHTLDGECIERKFWECEPAKPKPQIYEYRGQQYEIATDDPVEAKKKILAYLADPKNKGNGELSDAAVLGPVPAPKQQQKIDTVDDGNKWPGTEIIGAFDDLIPSKNKSVFRWGQFLIFALLPVLAMWTLSYLMAWIIAGFRKGN